MLPIIEVKELYKKYPYGLKQPYYSLRDTVNSAIKSPFSILKSKIKNKGEIKEREFWALKDISFKVMPGEVIGIIGRNGAGKSTLLKILSRITPPTKGEIILRGRVASLLEVGTGFHPELTGRENIYLNGAILGMKRLEINDKFDEIVEFAEMSKFLDTPVKFYSSGMYMRLAFAVAAHLEPEILLVDEVLAVGDIEFQKKCLGKMGEVAKEGRTVLFVSHNMVAIQSLCSRAIMLDEGKIETDNEVEMTINKYLKIIKANTNQPLGQRKDRIGRGKIKIYEIEFIGENRSTTLIRGKNIYIIVKVKSYYQIDIEARLAITIGVQNGNGILSCDSQLIGKRYRIPATTKSVLICKLFSPPLNTGNYYINVALFYKGEPEDWITSAAHFSIEPGRFNGHININNFPVLSKFEWSVEK